MMWHDLSFRLRALFGRRRIENDLEDELGFHLDRAAAKLVASGVPAPDARRRARREFGLVDGVKTTAGARGACGGWTSRDGTRSTGSGCSGIDPGSAPRSWGRWRSALAPTPRFSA